MKKLSVTFFIITFALLFRGHIYAQSVGINTGNAQPHNSSILDISSTNKGLLMPRMTMTQRNNINDPATGLIIFQTDNTPGFYFNAGTGGSPNWIRVETVGGGGGGVWAANGTGIYNTNTGHVGIGTNTPAYDLHINRSDPTIGFTDVDDNHFSGVIEGDSTNLAINAYRKNFIGNNQAGNLLLQTSNGNFTAGNVGIGTRSPMQKLDIAGGLKVSDNIFAGGNVNANGNVYTENIYVDGKVLRSGSGPNNLVPVAYGKIDGNSGTIIGGTSNFNVVKNGSGDYSISLLGESNVYQFSEQYIIFLTPYTSVPRMMVAEIQQDNTIRVRMAKSAVHYTNSACACELFSRITDASFYDYIDDRFSFLIYKR